MNKYLKEDIKYTLDYLETHNKNYTQAQYNKILELRGMFKVLKQELKEVIKNALWNLEQVDGTTDWDNELLDDGLKHIYTILKELA